MLAISKRRSCFKSKVSEHIFQRSQPLYRVKNKMADSDVPELVESSEDEFREEEMLDASKKYVVYAEKWLKKEQSYKDKQDLWMRVFCMGPFLFACNNVISASWVKALINAKLLNEKRQYELTFFEWPEWECLDLMDCVITDVQRTMKNIATLSSVLDCAERLDDDSCKSGVIVDVDLAIQEAEKCSEIKDIWRCVQKSEYASGKEKEAKFAVLYVIRIYKEHVVFLCERNADFIDHTKKLVRKNNFSKMAEEHKKKGNECFGDERYDEAIKHYTAACEQDPFNHVYYGNRAQAYNKLKKFEYALADGRRAVTVKPDFPKGHYRYAYALAEKGQLEKAIRQNKRGQFLCRKSSDFDNIQALKEQGEKLQSEKLTSRGKNQVLTSIPKHLDEKLSSIPMSSDGGDLSDKLGCKPPPNHLRDNDVPMLVDSDTCSSSSDEDSSPARSTKTDKGKANKHKHGGKDKQKDGMLESDFELQQGLLQELKRSRDELKRELFLMLQEGYVAYCKDAHKGAMSVYHKALEILAQRTDGDTFEMDESDIVTLKYAYGITAIATGNYKNIVDGLHMMQEIIEKHQDIRFPAAYYGLGKGYITLNRFQAAIEPLTSGLTIATNVRYAQVTWPGTKETIRETVCNVLKEQFRDLLKLCKCPPPPDATCRYHTDSISGRTAIYLSDPDFKGYVKMMCEMDCAVTFHHTCWKTYKSTLNKQIDKDVLDTGCPTPDCAGLIIKIHIIRADSLLKEYTSEKYCEAAVKETSKNKKPISKQKTTNENKIAKKQEKKEKRKKKKRENEDNLDTSGTSNHVPEPVIVDGASACAFIEDMEGDTQPLPNIRDTTVLKKDDLEIKPAVGKSRKSRKKKDKSKQILAVEVNFTDRREETLLNEHSALSDEDTKKGPDSSSLPFSVPAELKPQINSFEKSYQGTTQQLFVPDEITENVFSYFGDMFKVNGPLPIDDPKIREELEVFPFEATEKIKQVGGLGDFLKQSLKFVVIDDVIGLMSDAKRARELALARRTEREAKGAVPVAETVWKTVGKSVNNADSLSESVAQNTGFPGLQTPFSSVLQAHPGSSSLPRTMNSNVNNSSMVDSYQFSSVSGPMPPSANHWSGSVSSYGIPSETRPLDSIDDIPIEPVKQQRKTHTIDDIDDFDVMSDSGSDNRYSQASNNRSNLDPRMSYGGNAKLDSNMSRSSSKSDLSEHSSRSDFSSNLSAEPKPLKLMNVGGLGFGIGPKKGPGIWDKGETTTSAFSKDDFESLEPVTPESVNREIRKVGEEFVRKSDEKFVAELAESVVQKMFEGRSVSEAERLTVLNQIQSDIWKDFERSAQAQKQGESGLWANTPVDGDYSKNLGKFANDFMKRHYDSIDGVLSPTSNVNLIYPKKPLDTFSSSFNSNSGFNSMLLPTSSPSVETVTSSIPASTEISYPPDSSGYNLFSGPSWGLDTFGSITSEPFSRPPPNVTINSISSPSAGGPITPPSSTMPPPILPSASVPPPFIRPPMSASSFYQAPPNMGGLGRMPIRPPVGPPRMPFPPMGMQRMPYPSMKWPEKRDAECQCVQLSITQSTNTDQPYETSDYQQIKMERDQLHTLLADWKQSFQKMQQEYQSREQRFKMIEGEYQKNKGLYEGEQKKMVIELEQKREHCHKLQEHAASIEQRNKELTEKMAVQEKKVNEITVHAKEQRDKDVSEMKKCMESFELLRRMSEMEAERAKTAELSILQMKLQAACTMLERSQKEAMFQQQNLSTMKNRQQEGKNQVPEAVQQTLDYFTSMARLTEDSISKVKAEYEVQMDQVRQGKKLSELSPIRIPTPPPMPDATKSFMQHMMGRMAEQMNRHGIHSSASAPSLMNSITFPPQSSSQQGPVYNASTSSLTPAVSSYASPSTAPLKPLTAGPGSMPAPVRPLAGTRAPLGVAPLPLPQRAPLRPLGGASGGLQPTQMTSFEKLVLKLKISFPDKSRSEVSELIQALRQSRGGSLSGLTMEEIQAQITELIRQKGAVKNAQRNAQAAPMAPPPGLSSSWAFHASGKPAGVGPAGGLATELYREEEEDPCVICHEEMASQHIVTLQCGHFFHDHCIRKWFQEQSTCPNCRVHALLMDDFPSLK